MFVLPLLYHPTTSKFPTSTRWCGSSAACTWCEMTHRAPGGEILPPQSLRACVNRLCPPRQCLWPEMLRDVNMIGGSMFGWLFYFSSFAVRIPNALATLGCCGRNRGQPESPAKEDTYVPAHKAAVVPGEERLDLNSSRRGSETVTDCSGTVLGAPEALSCSDSSLSRC
jgi:hypothetical protein